MYEPTTGIDFMNPSAIAQAGARTAGRRGASSRRSPRGCRAAAAAQPTTQLISRGLRKAPVKKTRIMWTNIAAMKSIAAQWCICRISRPPRTSKEMFSVDA